MPDNYAKPPRFPYIAAVLCVACMGAALWTWMRYSYVWDVTAQDLAMQDAALLYRDKWSGRYVRLAAEPDMEWHVFPVAKGCAPLAAYAPLVGKTVTRADDGQALARGAPQPEDPSQGRNANAPGTNLPVWRMRNRLLQNRITTTESIIDEDGHCIEWVSTTTYFFDETFFVRAPEAWHSYHMELRDAWTGRVTDDQAHGFDVVLDTYASRFTRASIAGLVVGAMGVFAFAVALRHWLRERTRFREGAKEA